MSQAAREAPHAHDTLRVVAARLHAVCTGLRRPGQAGRHVLALGGRDGDLQHRLGGAEVHLPARAPLADLRPEPLVRGQPRAELPSGEVTAITAAVTPFIVNYG